MSLVAQQKEYHETRCKLHDEIKSFIDAEDALVAGGDEAKPGWGDEANAKFAELNTAYNENYAKLEDVQNQLKAQAGQKEETEKRIAEIDAHAASYQAPANIGRDGGNLETGPLNTAAFGTDGAATLPADFIGCQALALQGWMLNGSAGQEHRVTDEHRKAAKAMRTSLNSSEFEIHLGDIREFQKRQAVYSALGPKAQIYNALQEGQGSKGGVLVGETLLSSLEEAMLAFSGVLQVADVINTTTGEQMFWPTADDTGNEGMMIGESQDVGDGNDPSFGRLRLQAFTFTSRQINISRTIIRDAVLNLEAVLGKMMGTRIGRTMNKRFTTGTGGGIEPMGIVNGSTLGVTAASATALVFDELIDLEHSVDPSRRSAPSVGYMFHDTILKVIRKFKDGNANYLWTRGVTASAPDSINGYRYWINQNMVAAFSSGNKTVLFGELNTYKVRRVGTIKMQRLIERRAEFNEDAFIAYEDADGGPLDAGDGPIRHIVH